MSVDAPGLVGSGVLPSLSVVVVLHNSREHLDFCLGALPPEHELIVVDNASTDGGPQLVADIRPDAYIHRAGENLGFGVACNIGAGLAQNDLLMFLNPDASISARDIDELRRRAFELPHAVLGPMLVDRQGARQANVRRPSRAAYDVLELLPGASDWTPPYLVRDLPLTAAVYLEGGEVAYLQGACLLLRRELFLRAGGFDPDFFLYGEEETLAARVRAVGGTCVFVPSAAATHIQGTSTAKVSRFATQHLYRSKAVLYRKRHGDVGGRMRAACIASAALLALTRAVGRSLTRRSAGYVSVSFCVDVLSGLRAGATDVVIADPAYTSRPRRARAWRRRRVPSRPPRVLSDDVVRLVVVADWFQKVAANQALAMQRQGLASVTFVCTDHAFEFGGDSAERRRLLDELRSEGVTVVELSAITVPRAAYWARRPRAFVSAVHGAHRAGRQIRRLRPHALYVHENERFVLLAATARVGASVGLVVHDVVPHPGQQSLRPLQWLARRLWYRRAAGIFVHGEHLREQMFSVGCPLPVFVIPHGSWPLHEPLPAPKAKAVGFFGRLEPYKGLHVLLSAMAHVWAVAPDVQLLVAGRGPEEWRIPRRDHRVLARVGYFPESELESLLRQVTVIALPYVEGSQSGVGSAAIAHGVPLVVTDVGGLPNLVPDRGLVVPPNSPDALGAALLEALRQGPALRAATLDHARTTNSFDVTARAVLSAFEELTVSSHGRAARREWLRRAASE